MWVCGGGGMPTSFLQDICVYFNFFTKMQFVSFSKERNLEYMLHGMTEFPEFRILKLFYLISYYLLCCYQALNGKE